MAAIDDVIARARRPGAFSERKRFTVARTRAIEKLRRFALADPHFYVLELIQSAIANGAAYIDLDLQDDRCMLSYVGGGLRAHELGQLFDFLFASKDRADIGHVRELALGINAALLFEPARVTVESGDGTLANTTRMVMHKGAQEIEVGQPAQPLTGTYVHIEGMNRRAVASGWGKLSLGDRKRELDVIEERCLASPVPIIMNGTPLFGYSRQRTPGLFGYDHVVTIDEGDLYGALGSGPSFPNPSISLLTFGVSIQSKEVELVPGARMGGIVCYDRLRKTVDHSGIVEDEVLAQLWSRLKPYAALLATGRTHLSPWSAAFLGEHEAASPTMLRQRLAGARRVVIVPSRIRLESPEGARASAIGQALEAPVLCVDDPDLGALRAMTGGQATFVAPELANPADTAFYTSAAAGPPARPWLASAVNAPPMSSLEAAARVLGRPANDPFVPSFAAKLGVGEIGATIYTPSAAASDMLDVQVRSADRIAWAGRIASAYPGHLLVIDTPDTKRSALLAPLQGRAGAPSLAEALAVAVADHAAGAFAEAFERAAATLVEADVEPHTSAASVVLAAVARAAIARLRTPAGEGFACVDLVCVGESERALLKRPVLRTLAGTRLSVADLPELLAQGQGHLYGTNRDVPADLEGLDPSRILDLTLGDERILLDIFGEGAYVRIDRRDVLAEHRGVKVRDFAIGLREYPPLPLLVEGEDPRAWPASEQAACWDDLLGQLRSRAAGIEPALPHSPSEQDDWEECRRQAVRHLRWFVASVAPPELAELHARMAMRPLFVDAEGRSCSLAALVRQRSAFGVVYGVTIGADRLGPVAAADRDTAVSRTLALDPATFLRLRSVLSLRPAFEVAMAPGEAEPASSWIASITIEDARLRGQIGVPHRPENARIAIVLGDGRRAGLPEIAHGYGVGGVVRLAAGATWDEELLGLVRDAAARALRQVLDDLSASEHDEIGLTRRIEALLQHVHAHLALHVHADARITAHPVGELCDRILSLPIFAAAAGGRIPGWRLVHRFCTAVAGREADPTRQMLGELARDVPAPLHELLARILHPGRLIRAAASARPVALPGIRHDYVSPEHVRLASTLEHWIAKLRPDDHGPTRIQLTYTEGEDFFAEGDMQQLWVNPWHPLVKNASKESNDDPTALAWLLLTLYGRINALEDPVTHEHERQFQLRVAQVVQAGQLGFVPPRS